MNSDFILILIIIIMTAFDRYLMLKRKSLLLYTPDPIQAWKDIFLYAGFISLICWFALWVMPNSIIFRYIPSILAIGDVLLGLFVPADIDSYFVRSRLLQQSQRLFQ